MALVFRNFELSVDLSETSGSSVTRSFQLTSADATQAAIDAAAIRAALAAITNSVIKGYRLSHVYQEDALALPAAAENQDIASLTLRLDAPGVKTTRVTVPAPKVGIFSAATGPNYNVVDITDGDLLAYLALFKTTGGVVEISDGETISDTEPILYGKRISAKHSGPKIRL